MGNLNRCGGLLLLLLLISGTGGGVAELQWQTLTKSNYSSQIRLHPHILLLVTVPWSGETRSLMKELTHVVASDEARFGTLKLMVIYRNVERMLAKALGASDRNTIIYCHDAISYKYRGRLRVQNILSSVHYVMSLSPDELPLKSLTTPDQLNDFLRSTDKAVLLLEFCGWTQRLLAMNKSMTESELGFPGTGFRRGNSGTLTGRDNMKVEEDGKLSCRNHNGFSEVSWPSQFTPINVCHVKEAESMTLSDEETCDSYEFQQFEGFLQKLITFSREFFLPPERLRFAMVPERSLLPFLNIEEPGPWLMSVYFAGCPNCSQVLKEVDDLRAVLQAHSSPVSELEEDPPGVVAALSAERPTMILFVDRSSDSVQIRTESQEALDDFREFAKHTELSNQIHGQATIRPAKTIESNRASLNSIKKHRVQPFTSSQNLIGKDKVSIMVLHEGRQVALEDLVPDSQSKSVREILTSALKQKKLKLSTLAKDSGFQLLSKDFDIEVLESSVSHGEDQTNQGLGETHVEDVDDKSAVIDNREIADVSSSGWQDFDIEALESSASHGEDQTNQGLGETHMEDVDDKSSAIDKREITDVSSSGWQEGPPDPSDECTMLKGEEDSLDQSSLSSVEPHHHIPSTCSASDDAQGWSSTKSTYSGIDENKQPKDFIGSFVFLDGEYRLLETLTGGSMIPSVVITDPISQKHYVLTGQSVVRYSSLSLFVDDFLAGRLSPYLQSAAVVPSTRNAQRPPFVNLDFHETDSIPQVTTHTFTELVLGNNSDPKKPDHWDRNVLVLFSNSWCGFCQRMELIVREVYRSVKGYANMKINSSKEKWMLKDDSLKLPLIYMMDCTQNDCNLIVKTILQREDHPLLLLFPAERKNNTVSYEGDISVSGIIKFLASHGSHVIDLIMDKSFPGDQSTATDEQIHHKVVLKDRLQNAAVKYHQVNTPLAVSSDKRPQLTAGCFLTATEKLLDVHPFDESKILILKADPSTGFYGLIFNKHISWDSLQDLKEGLELLKKAPLSFGGPVMINGMPLAALSRRFIEGQSFEVLPSVYFVDQLATRSLLEEIKLGNRESVDDYWFFLGYSSWGYEQLFNEIEEGGWNVSKGNAEQLGWP